ncbi:MAG: type II toxin-antitoxin system VapB family antitoxin [Actinomycetota bacterium]|nr:type II toxin-antitoxin system VapB family antitoxin [Actinomycetota bacterium]
MRTTIAIDDELFRTFKARAAQHGTTLSAEIEEALRAEVAGRTQPPPLAPFKVESTDAEIRPGVDINSNVALIEFLGGDGGTLLDPEGRKVQ